MLKNIKINDEFTLTLEHDGKLTKDNFIYYANNKLYLHKGNNYPLNLDNYQVDFNQIKNIIKDLNLDYFTAQSCDIEGYVSFRGFFIKENLYKKIENLAMNFLKKYPQYKEETCIRRYSGKLTPANKEDIIRYILKPLTSYGSYETTDEMVYDLSHFCKGNKLLKDIAPLIYNRSYIYHAGGSATYLRGDLAE